MNAYPHPKVKSTHDLEGVALLTTCVHHIKYMTIFLPASRGYGPSKVHGKKRIKHFHTQRMPPKQGKKKGTLI